MPHSVAVAGFSSDPWRYERGRPGYPPDALRLIFDVVPNGPGDVILTLAPAPGS